ncbi:Holliday junction branch migration protein RuvA [Enterococcus casseliflavus]|uniref:Holliday junction branch migration protein RuvA n=1 Tax=Enterococcus casseliflavus TaxID=37734 RepID=UPI000EB00721|nr:Holliday junction branch migration protein RuvA [Enterococcus casseliflavus]AYJ43964.1 Holliday junction branch migration protein RuvA [Enterococcus casseliflavus]MBS5814167.1 Holliday junction branch migration protein RuvA [Enterococcus casseliflavus]MCD4960699.1 Holliday junction branch migration protein RuvA [Enterococcus casseliflavus]MDT2978642.1 Holliday junction branch migration protein RuvA [Enterococcus casseliflavus]MDU3373291.1 Holliday junction branch migration protein RuvA [Ent
MYEYIIGKVTDIFPAYIVVETHGIGYQIAFGNPYSFSGKLNQEVKIYLHQVIREDAHSLYGFATIEGKRLFLKLISVSGIGPKSALAIMANEDHTGLITAVENGDVNYLTKFPGVGKKTAQQMILDLKGKVAELVGEEAIVPLSVATTALDEAMEALKALGYSEKEVKKAEKQLAANTTKSTDEYLREALRLMMKK